MKGAWTWASTPMSRGSHISSREAVVRATRARPIRAPSSVSRSYRFTSSAGGTSQQAVVCISCSGMLIEPQPTFSWVWYLIFLNMVTFQATITSPRCRWPAGG